MLSSWHTPSVILIRVCCTAFVGIALVINVASIVKWFVCLNPLSIFLLDVPSILVGKLLWYQKILSIIPICVISFCNHSFKFSQIFLSINCVWCDWSLSFRDWLPAFNTKGSSIDLTKDSAHCFSNTKVDVFCLSCLLECTTFFTFRVTTTLKIAFAARACRHELRTFRCILSCGRAIYQVSWLDLGRSGTEK
jgi:hypothetical protein